MTASPPRPVPPLVRPLLDVREILERARRTGDRREIEAAIERINAALADRGYADHQSGEKGAVPGLLAVN